LYVYMEKKEWGVKGAREGEDEKPNIRKPAKDLGETKKQPLTGNRKKKKGRCVQNGTPGEKKNKGVRGWTGGGRQKASTNKDKGTQAYQAKPMEIHAVAWPGNKKKKKKNWTGTTKFRKRRGKELGEKRLGGGVNRTRCETP